MSLAEIGRRVGRHESTVAYWVEKHGLEAGNRKRHAARGALSRQDLEQLVHADASIAEIAAQLDRSKATIRHWLQKYGLKTAKAGGRRRTEASRAAIEAGLTRTTMICANHGETEFVLEGRGYYRCMRCRSAAVTRRRRSMKATLVQEAGGACRICSYSRCLAALEFHHLVPADKTFALSQQGVARSLEKARAEAEKCILLCANCHAEVEAGMITVGQDLAARIQ